MDEQTRWGLIESAARALGVNPEASKKWRRRGVPHKWRLPIIQKTAGALTSDNFHPFREIAAGGCSQESCGPARPAAAQENAAPEIGDAA